MNTTDTYWSVNGVSLQTMAYNIETWGGTLQAPPALRGSDVTIPYRPGQVLQQRVPNSRTLTFQMWVVGADLDGNVPTNVTARAQFEKNLKDLRDLFWNEGKPVTLTRRWKDYGSSTVRTASAQAIFSSGFVPAMTGRQRAVFSVDLLLPDPFFYGSSVNVPFPAGASSTQTFTVPGDYPTDRITITFNGDRNNIQLTNQTDGNSWVRVAGQLLSPSTVVLTVHNWTARKGSTNIIRDVTFQGNNKSWMLLHPGTQTLILSSDSGTGSATLTYQPRWI